MGFLDKANSLLKYYLATGTAKGWREYSDKHEKTAPKEKSEGMKIKLPDFLTGAFKRPESVKPAPSQAVVPVPSAPQKSFPSPIAAQPARVPDIVIDETKPPKPSGQAAQLPARENNPFAAPVPTGQQAPVPARRSVYAVPKKYYGWPDTNEDAASVTITINARHTTPMLLNICIYLSLILWIILMFLGLIFGGYVTGAMEYIASFAGKEFTSGNLFVWFVQYTIILIVPPFAFYFGLKPLFHINTIIEFSEHSIRIKKNFLKWGIIPAYGWYGPYDRTLEHHFYIEEPRELYFWEKFGKHNEPPPFLIRKAADSARLMFKHETILMEVTTIYGYEQTMQFTNRVENVDRYMAEFVHLCRNRPV